MHAVRRLIPKGTQSVRTFCLGSAVNMPIKVGDKIPDVTVFDGTDSHDPVKTGELFAGKKAVVFAVPGAFTPGCSMTHLPGYIENADKLKAKGVDLIACVSINDPFVMSAWSKAQGAEGKIRMLADATGEFTRAIDMEFGDLKAILGNARSKRYSLVVENGVVKNVNLEPDGKGLTCSLAPEVLSQV